MAKITLLNDLVAAGDAIAPKSETIWFSSVLNISCNGIGPVWGLLGQVRGIYSQLHATESGF